ncbi:hypothetical protein EJ04DRAFT_563284 [Polyplosphaeria fusca]|uniref:Uncharacterized protein n=1 Tax=Polyplosphaeria fusca TaxID=682080 RepID=A0A9P4V2G9_9PLEO|nr:hypothetical protein EJ04DRAFT_563284 [Polyplosphaeria fusca]
MDAEVDQLTAEMVTELRKLPAEPEEAKHSHPKAQILQVKAKLEAKTKLQADMATDKADLGRLSAEFTAELQKPRPRQMNQSELEEKE